MLHIYSPEQVLPRPAVVDARVEGDHVPLLLAKPAAQNKRTSSDFSRLSLQYPFTGVLQARKKGRKRRNSDDLQRQARDQCIKRAGNGSCSFRAKYAYQVSMHAMAFVVGPACSFAPFCAQPTQVRTAAHTSESRQQRADSRQQTATSGVSPSAPAFPFVWIRVDSVAFEKSTIDVHLLSPGIGCAGSFGSLVGPPLVHDQPPLCCTLASGPAGNKRHFFSRALF